MPDPDDHLRQAQRNEALVRYIGAPGLPYQEWVVIAWFYICVQYIDAFLARKGHRQVRDHDDRFTKMRLYRETQEVVDEYEMLYKESKEARYQCTPYTGADLAEVQKTYDVVREKLRAALRLP